MTFAISVQNTTAPANRAPTITGSPATSVTAGTAYSFTPVGSDPDGNSLTYSIVNRPSWATFNASTGRLSGTPQAAHVGTSARITISVTNTLTNPQTDVDLRVFRGNEFGLLVGEDIRVPAQTRNCQVDFFVPATDTYVIQLENLGPGTAASCAVQILQQ